MESGSAFRVNGAQLRHNRFNAFPVSQGFQFLTPSGGRVGSKAVAPDQGVHIKTGAAGDDGYLSPGENVLDNRRGRFAIAADGEILIRLADIQHMVGNALHFFRRGLGGADVHAAIDLHGIAGNYLAVYHFCQFHGKSGLSGGRRPGNAYDLVHNDLQYFL